MKRGYPGQILGPPEKIQKTEHNEVFKGGPQLAALLNAEFKKQNVDISAQPNILMNRDNGILFIELQGKDAVSNEGKILDAGSRETGHLEKGLLVTLPLENEKINDFVENVQKTEFSHSGPKPSESMQMD